MNDQQNKNIEDRYDKSPADVPSVQQIPTGVLMNCLVWRDGGTTDGDSSTQCNRTYNVRTPAATGPATGGVEIGTGMTPAKNRQETGQLWTPPTTGAGVLGWYYIDSDGSPVLWDANEYSLTIEACT